MRLFLLWVAISSLAIVGALGNNVQIVASIEIPPEDITSLVANPNDTFQGYKIINEINGEIYIGGKETLIIYNAPDNRTESLTFVASVDPNEFVTCERIIAEENRERVCQHYIRLAEQVNSDSLLVCGTNKQTPRCDLVNMTTDARISFGASDQTQHTVNQNTTARFYDGFLYIGFNEGTQANPSHISKFRVTEGGLEEVAETDDQNENFVNEPHFVGKPYVKDGHMYFFYRETAVEAVNQGKFVYSRVARICLNAESGNFDIFVKARLNCSLQGKYPFYFNHIQDVISEEQDDGDTIFYAVFTTTPHGPSSSAVCSYKLSDIDEVFENSKFKGKSTGKLPGPVDRPVYADKFTDCEQLSTEEKNFLKRNPLMDSLVPNYNAENPDSRSGTSHKPLFFSTSTNFYSIAVDSVDGEKIFYIGTEHGTIIKAYHDSDEGEYVFYEQEIWDAKSAVTGLRVDNVTRTLLVVTGEGLFRVNLEGCNANCEKECNEFYYPYCTSSGESCHSKRSTDETSNQKAVEKVKILSLPPGDTPVISSCNSRKVELTCEVKSSTLCGDANLVWKMGDGEILVNCTGENQCQGGNSPVGHIVKFREIVRKAHYKLVHLTVDVHSGKTNETFTCMFDNKNSKKTVKIDMDDSEGCLTHELYTQRKEHRNKLEAERDSLEMCTTSPDQPVTSENVLFKRCSECPGNPEINDNA